MDRPRIRIPVYRRRRGNRRSPMYRWWSIRPLIYRIRSLRSRCRCRGRTPMGTAAKTAASAPAGRPGKRMAGTAPMRTEAMGRAGPVDAAAARPAGTATRPTHGNPFCYFSSSQSLLSYYYPHYTTNKKRCPQFPYIFRKYLSHFFPVCHTFCFTMCDTGMPCLCGFAGICHAKSPVTREIKLYIENFMVRSILSQENIPWNILWCHITK